MQRYTSISLCVIMFLCLRLNLFVSGSLSLNYVSLEATSCLLCSSIKDFAGFPENFQIFIFSDFHIFRFSESKKEKYKQTWLWTRMFCFSCLVVHHLTIETFHVRSESWSAQKHTWPLSPKPKWQFSQGVQKLCRKQYDLIILGEGERLYFHFLSQRFVEEKTILNRGKLSSIWWGSINPLNPGFWS